MWFIYHCSLLASYHSDRKRLKIKHTQSLTEDIEKKKYQQNNNTNKERKKLEFCCFCCCLHFGGGAGVVLHTVFVLALVVRMGDINMRT